MGEGTRDQGLGVRGWGLGKAAAKWLVRGSWFVGRGSIHQAPTTNLYSVVRGSGFGIGGPWFVGRGSRFVRPATNHQPPTTRDRNAITLLEVLISMGVLLLGLMGVGAMLAGGRFEVLQGAKTDQATMVGRAAFRDLKVRGFLNPANWIDSFGNLVLKDNHLAGQPQKWKYWFSCQCASPSAGGDGMPVTPTVVLDPLGVAAGFGNQFPNPAPASYYLSRLSPSSQVSSLSLADPIFRMPDDLITVANPVATSKDAPPAQQMFPMVTNPPPGSGYYKRASDGNYSWLATVVCDPLAYEVRSYLLPAKTVSVTTGKMTVSVAVFYKRDLGTAGEGYATATPAVVLGGGIGGGEFQLTNFQDPNSKFKQGVKPGQWIMLAGTNGTYNYFRWYRVAAADTFTGSQNVTLAGPDWNTSLSPIYAYLFEGIVAVYEKNMSLELASGP